MEGGGEHIPVFARMMLDRNTKYALFASGEFVAKPIISGAKTL